MLGSGAYGIVCEACDYNTKRKVAIKKTERVFDHELLAKRTLRELKILRLLDHDNVMKILTIQKP